MGADEVQALIIIFVVITALYIVLYNLGILRK